MASSRDTNENEAGENGNIYDEIRPALPKRRVCKFKTKYDSLPAANKLESYSKVDLKNPNQEFEEVTDRNKRAFSDIIAKKVSQMKHQLIRRISDQDNVAENVSETRRKQDRLYRSKSTENLISIDAPYSTKHLPFSFAGVPCVVDDSVVNPGNAYICMYDYPRPIRPELPAKKTWRDNRDYVNTLLARATVSPMRCGKPDIPTIDSDSSSIYDTVAEPDEGSNIQTLKEDNAYYNLRKESGLKIHKCSTKGKRTPPVTRDFQRTDKLKNSKIDEVGMNVYVDKDDDEENKKLVHWIKTKKRSVSDEETRATITGLRAMTITDIGERLKELSLGNYIEMFKENQVDGMILANLKTDDLIQELGMKRLEAVRLCTFVESGHIPK